MGTGIVNWDDVDPKPAGSSGGDGKKVVYKKLTPDKSHKIRPVHKPMAVYKYFSREGGKTRSAIVGDPETCPVREKHDLKPTLRYAINIIDREDGQLKVLEGPPTVFRAFRKWFEMTGKKPGGEKGGDFGIDVEVPDGNKLQTKYTCQFVEPTPFTQEELKMIKEDPGIYNLPDIYKPNSPTEIERLLFSDDPYGKKESESKSESKSKSKSKNTDDLFDDDDNDTKESKGGGDDDDEMSW